MSDQKANLATGENPVDLRALAPRTKALAEKVGLQRTYDFFVKFEAITLYIPSSLKHSNLADKVGEDVALALVELYPVSHYTPNKIDKMLQLWRNHEIINSTEGTRDLCIKFNITRSRIAQIRQDHANNVVTKFTQPQFENLSLDLDL